MVFQNRYSVPSNFSTVIQVDGVHKDSGGVVRWIQVRCHRQLHLLKSLLVLILKGECGGVSRPARNTCYLITLNLYPKDGKITWGQEMTLGKEDFGAGSRRSGIPD